jgi:hypothetical protein
VDVPETTKPLHFCRGFVLYGAGTRRTVCFAETRFSGRLEFAGKFGVPQLVTINKSASYGSKWNRIRNSYRISTLLSVRALQMGGRLIEDCGEAVEACLH